MEIEGVTYSTELVEAFLQVKGKKDVLDLPRYWLEQHLITFKEGYDLGCVNKNGVEVAKRLEELKKLPRALVADIGRLWTKEGLPVAEVDLYLHAIVDGEKMGSQIHTYTVDGEYELLPQDEDDKIPTTIWNIREIRAHAVEHK